MSKLLSKTKSKIKNFNASRKKIVKRIKESQNLPKSKRKSAFLGMATVFWICGTLTIFGVPLSAFAKDISAATPSPALNPLNSKPLPSEEIRKALFGSAATICGLAVTSGSFLVGAACGVVVVIGILQSQGK